MNVDTIRTDIPTSSTVTDVIIWDIEQSGENAFTATYEVDQQIKEGDQTRNVSETYTVKVHVAADGDMVIIQNPTLAPAMEKSSYEPKAQLRHFWKHSSSCTLPLQKRSLLIM